MSRETLRDSHSRILGYIETDSNGKQTGRDAHLRLMGYYDPRTNQTRDAHLRMVSYGNTLASLITAC